MIKILYFASLKERLNTESESFEYAGPMSVADLRAQLRARGNVWEEVFAEEQLVMAAVDQAIADPSTQVNDGNEVAFFPPVTGG